MSCLFHSIVKPLATVKTPGAFLAGLRVMAVDGTLVDVPDSQANSRNVFSTKTTDFFDF